MIRITVELLSARTGKRSVLGIMDISNDGTQEFGSSRGHYNGIIYRKGTSTPLKKGRVENHARHSLPVWVLIKKMLQEIYDGKRRNKHLEKLAPEMDEVGDLIS